LKLVQGSSTTRPDRFANNIVQIEGNLQQAKQDSAPMLTSDIKGTSSGQKTLWRLRHTRGSGAQGIYDDSIYNE
jgi:hypothetical protein